MGSSRAATIICGSVSLARVMASIPKPAAPITAKPDRASIRCVSARLEGSWSMMMTLGFLDMMTPI